MTPFLRDRAADYPRIDAELQELADEIEHCRQGRDRSGMLAALGQIGDRFRAKGRQDVAIAHLEAAVALAVELGDQSQLVANFIRLGAAYQYDSDHERAEQLLTRALAIAKEHRNADLASSAYQHLGKCLAEMGEFVRARECFEAALLSKANIVDVSLVASTEEALAELTRRFPTP